jgi:hypothetical protein
MEIQRIHRTYPQIGDARVRAQRCDTATQGAAASNSPGGHPDDCECAGTGWIAVEDCVSGDLIDTRCPGRVS